MRIFNDNFWMYLFSIKIRCGSLFRTAPEAVPMRKHNACMYFHGEIRKKRPGPEVIKPFSCSTQLSTKF